MSPNHSDDAMVEQLFLDIKIQEVTNQSFGTRFIEPWASMYIDSIRDGRYGDAIWARYHIFGSVKENGIVDGTIKTVLEEIEEDAVEARVGESDLYEEALALYAKTSSTDGHPEVIDLLMRVGRTHLSVLEAQLEALREAPSVCAHCGSSSPNHFKLVKDLE